MTRYPTKALPMLQLNARSLPVPWVLTGCSSPALWSRKPAPSWQSKAVLRSLGGRVQDTTGVQLILLGSTLDAQLRWHSIHKNTTTTQLGISPTEPLLFALRPGAPLLARGISRPDVGTVLFLTPKNSDVSGNGGSLCSIPAAFGWAQQLAIKLPVRFHSANTPTK